MHPLKHLLIIAVIALVADSASAARRSPPTCGAILSGNRVYVLPADLDCSTATAPIIVRDRAVLNLNNHVYVGPILLEGRQAQLRDGTVECILAGTDGGPLDDPRCVRLEGAGKHTVQNVLVLYRETDGFGVGIWVSSDENRLTGNTIFQAPDSSVTVLGNKNILQQNRAILTNSGVGFYVDGDENKLIGNYATLHHAGYAIDEGNNNVLSENVYAGPDDRTVTDEGFGIGYGSGNRLTRNVVMHEDFGILMGNLAGPNTIDNNIAIRNGIDLFDYHPECDSNVWENNIFETSNQPCIGGTTRTVASTSALEKFTALLHRLRKMNPTTGQKVFLR